MKGHLFTLIFGAFMAFILVPSALSAQCGMVVSAADATICAGNSATLTVSASGATAPYTYAWTNGQTGENISVTPTNFQAAGIRYGRAIGDGTNGWPASV